MALAAQAVNQTRNSQEMAATEELLDVTLADAYRRNRNSRSKTKNLRCFPSCCEGGHVNNGFCGRAITFTIRRQATNLYACATFCAVDANLDLPTEIPEERGKTNPLGFWIPVKVESISEGFFKLTVNPELLGWHYSWKATKATRNTKHTLRTCLFEATGDKAGDKGRSLGFLCNVDTESFLLYSGVEKNDEQLEANEKRLADKRKGPDEETADLTLLSRRKVAVEEPCVQATGIRDPSRQNLDGIPMRKLLQKVTMPHRERAYYGKGIWSTGEENGRCEIPEEADAQRSFEEFLDFYPGDLLEEFNLDQEDSNTLEELEDDFELCEEAEEVVLRAMTSDQLADELVEFFKECSSGLVGNALCEYIDIVEDTEECNTLVPFAKILFRKFQTIITRRIETELYENGFLSQCTIQPDVRGITFCEL